MLAVDTDGSHRHLPAEGVRNGTAPPAFSVLSQQRSCCHLFVFYAAAVFLFYAISSRMTECALYGLISRFSVYLSCSLTGRHRIFPPIGWSLCSQCVLLCLLLLRRLSRLRIHWNATRHALPEFCIRLCFVCRSSNSNRAARNVTVPVRGHDRYPSVSRCLSRTSAVSSSSGVLANFGVPSSSRYCE